MKKYFIIFLLCFLLFISNIATATAPATTTVTVTLVDTNGQVWSNAFITVEILPPFGNPSPLNNNGNSVQGMQRLFADGSGVFSVVLDDNLVVAPSGSLQKFTICPNATVPFCTVVTKSVTGATEDLSADINPNLTLVNLNASNPINRAYTDIEVTGGQGSLYWRVTDNHLRGFNGTSWQDIIASATNIKWNNILNPDGSLSLNMTNFSTLFQYGSTTGSGGGFPFSLAPGAPLTGAFYLSVVPAGATWGSKFPGSIIINSGSSFIIKFRISDSTFSPFIPDKLVVCRTLAGSTVVTDRATVTIASSSGPFSLPKGLYTTDTVNMSIDSAHDYYFLFYTPITNSGNIAMNSPTDPAVGGAITLYKQSGDHTADANLGSFPAGTSTTPFDEIDLIAGQQAMFDIVDADNNTGTNYLFRVRTGTSSTAKPFELCVKGTTDCVEFNANKIFKALGTATIEATKLINNTNADGIVKMASNASNSTTGVANFVQIIPHSNKLYAEEGTAAKAKMLLGGQLDAGAGNAINKIDVDGVITPIAINNTLHGIDTVGAITVNANTCNEQTFALTGVSVSYVVSVVAGYALEANLILSLGQVTNDQVKYRFCNPTGSNITTTAASIHISAIP
jgi:hypothetical protein